jgi:hypothetical protein
MIANQTNQTKQAVVNQVVRAAMDEQVPKTRLQQAFTVLMGENLEPPTPGREGFLSDSNACTYLGGISRSSLWRYRGMGLKYHKLCGRVVYKPNELDEFVMLQECSC